MKKISILEVYNIETKERKVLHEFEGIIEAPNWLKSGDMLYNANGRIWRYSPEHDTTTLVDTGVCQTCNNDHVPSPDEKWLAVSNSFDDAKGWGSHIWVLPIEGGEAKQVSQLSPSFLHGWSPDGELAYCAFRGSSNPKDATIDIYAMPAEGGEEHRLTDGIGYNDGPEYSPDGQSVWFNSTRSGLMQVFRMNRDGSGITQMTDDPESNNWFPHVSPDGAKVVYLAFRKGDLEAWQHVPDKHVSLWLMNADGTQKEKLFELFGGQGTINVNSWAADSKRFAFVSYRYEEE